MVHIIHMLCKNEEPLIVVNNPFKSFTPFLSGELLVRYSKRKSSPPEIVQEPTNGEIQKEPDPIPSEKDISPTESLEGASSLDLLAIHVEKLAQAMRCPICNSFMRQYHGGIRLCPNCDAFPTE